MSRFPLISTVFRVSCGMLLCLFAAAPASYSLAAEPVATHGSPAATGRDKPAIPAPPERSAERLVELARLGPQRPVQVAVLTGPGTSVTRHLIQSSLLCSPHITIHEVTAESIRAGALQSIDLVVFPGGLSSTQGGALGEDGRALVKEFVRAGGGYLGVCAGAYLATHHYEWSLGILDAKIVDAEKWARGYGDVKIEISSAGSQTLGVPAGSYDIYYHQGPLLTPGHDPNLGDYCPLAFYETEMAKEGANTGVMIGTTAIASGIFGKGRVICYSPHAEKTPALEEILVAGAAWAAGERSQADSISVAMAASAARVAARSVRAPVEAEQAAATAEERLQRVRSALAPATTALQESIRVAIYDHSTGTANSPRTLKKFLTDENGVRCVSVSPADIRAGVLNEFDVLIMPGGSGSLQASRLGKDGCETVRKFVRDGGGYVGICAGSYLASSYYDWSLHLINADVVDREHWARGTGSVTIGFSEQGQQAIGFSQPNARVYYGQGPLLAPGRDKGLPPYEEIACFLSEIAKNGAPTGVMVGTTAIARSTFGAGRVVCYSPHPESSGGPNELVLNGVKWAGQARSAIATVPSPTR